MKSFLVTLGMLVFTTVCTNTSAAPINVSCTDSVKSLGKLGAGSFTIVCPVNCTSGSVWGSNNSFTTDSGMCVACLQQGVTTMQGGWAKIKIGPGQPNYTGTFNNGVTSQNWGPYDSSFSCNK